MFTRVLNFRGAKNIDGGVGLVRDSATPVLREQKGYRGTTASADRDGGVFGILSLWDTEANRDGSFDVLAAGWELRRGQFPTNRARRDAVGGLSPRARRRAPRSRSRGRRW